MKPATAGEEGESCQRLTTEDRSYFEWGGKDRPPEKQLAAKWFAIYTTPRHEKRVSQYLNQREIEHYLPLYQTQRRWSDGSKVTLDLPLFPGYLFVHIDRSERVPGAASAGCSESRGRHGRPTGFVAGCGDRCAARGAFTASRRTAPIADRGAAGADSIRALAGMEGVVVRRKNSLRVVLTMDLIQQSVAVEVSGSELETMDSAGPSRARDSSGWSGPRPDGESRSRLLSRNLS